MVAEPTTGLPVPGAWPSPITADLVVAAASSVSGTRLDGGDLYYQEQRPHEGGRVQILRHRRGGAAPGPDEVLPDGFSARSRVHEYGGGAWTVHDGIVYFTNASDQRVWRTSVGGVPEPLTPEVDGDRYADLRVVGKTGWAVAIRERHGGAHDPAGVRNELVALPTTAGATGPGPVVVLSDATDFVAAPRPSPDGTLVAWVAWDLPAMPWQSSTLWVARLDLTTGPAAGPTDGPTDGPGGTPALAEPVAVLGGPGVSVTQPQWLPDGTLAVVSDRNGYWNLWEARKRGVPQPGAFHEATAVSGELAPPAWVFGQSSWCATPEGHRIGVWRFGGRDELGVVVAGEGDRVRWARIPHTAIDGLCTEAGLVAWVGSSFVSEAEVVVAGVPDLVRAVLDDTPIPLRVRRSPRDVGLDASWWSVPESITFPTTPLAPVDGHGDGAGGDGAPPAAHGFLYPPRNPDISGADDGEGPPPPLLVLIHGGPTSAARPQLSLAVQFWTSRGWAVLDVNYRGSVGFGRAYQDLLAGQWGVADVADCVAGATWLASQGRVDPQRMVIRGGSAGGFTALLALATTTTFAAGVSLYGIADLHLLAAETHKFEQGYNDWLLGDPDEHPDRYHDRSPINHVDAITSPLLVLQGAEDAVVPPSQAELVVDALRRRGVPVAYLLFDGEGHGFRQAGTLERALTAEHEFTTRVLGLGDVDHPTVEIDNLDS